MIELRVLGKRGVEWLKQQMKAQTGWLPARRAAKVDPMAALRAE